MKQFLLLSTFIAGSFTGIAQNEGSIQYTTKRDMHRTLEGTSAEAYKDFVPQFQEFKTELIFNEKVSLYQNVQDDTSNDMSPEDMEQGNVQVEIDFGGDESEDNKIYFDTESNTVIEQRDFLGKLFLLEETLEGIDWKVSEETDTILGKICTKATTIVDGNMNGESMNIDVAAWFTTEIPVSLGPGSYRGLPGIILKVDFDHGFEIIEATNIDMGTVTKSTLKKPNKGKKVTSEEYETIVAQRMKQMQEQFGGTDGEDGNVIIIQEGN